MKRLLAAAAALTLALSLAACSNNDNADNADDDGSGSYDCVVPYACGPMYNGFVPAYYGVHPFYPYMTPYVGLYSMPVYSPVTRSYSVTRTAAYASKPMLPVPSTFNANKPISSAFTSPWKLKTSTGSNAGTKTNTGTNTKTNTGTSKSDTVKSGGTGFKSGGKK